MERTVYTFPVHIKVLLAVTLIFVIVILVLLGVVLSSRIYKTNRAIKREQLRKKYQKIFRELLFEDQLLEQSILQTVDKNDLTIEFNRETIKDEIIHLHANFTGDAAERLEEIYMRLNFHFDSLKKLNDKRWYIIAQGMRELALMNVKQALPNISNFLNSKNEILRTESRVSVMKLSEEDPLSFLSNNDTLLTGWDTANIYSMLTKMPEKLIPFFGKWLHSPNKQIVMFCIQMTGAFRQQDTAGSLLPLLKSDDENIKLATIKTLRLLNAASSEKPLIDMYEKETITVRTEILKTLEITGSAHSAPLFEKILKRPFEDYPLSIQAVRSLLALGNTGNSIVDKIFANSDAQMKLVINHARDKRL
jgi:predicted Holliday junction resolvase-like endonuclease